MKKQDAIKLFGSGTALAKAIGVTKGRVSQLPEDLDLATTDRVVGAALRLGMLEALEGCLGEALLSTHRPGSQNPLI
ncbi:hypothetical protein CCP4SC76_1640004 [Gammaproteobacteria bacterium]